jgi:hypothetical protein
MGQPSSAWVEKDDDQQPHSIGSFAYHPNTIYSASEIAKLAPEFPVTLRAGQLKPSLTSIMSSQVIFSQH